MDLFVNDMLPLILEGAPFKYTYNDKHHVIQLSNLFDACGKDLEAYNDVLRRNRKFVFWETIKAEDKYTICFTPNKQYYNNFESAKNLFDHISKNVDYYRKRINGLKHLGISHYSEPAPEGVVCGIYPLMPEYFDIGIGSIVVEVVGFNGERNTVMMLTTMPTTTSSNC